MFSQEQRFLIVADIFPPKQHGVRYWNSQLQRYFFFLKEISVCAIAQWMEKGSNDIGLTANAGSVCIVPQ